MVAEAQDTDTKIESDEVLVEVPKAAENDGEGTKKRSGPRKPRHRNKALHAAILKQMEFYFSDSNLSKDRFLASLIREDPNVDIEVFLKFNKIRALTTDVSRIAKALKNSTFLKVSDDGKTISRTTPIEEKSDVDDYTIYVQRLPSDVDHDTITKLFSEYGPVAYVSIPRFKATKKPKGFAFVEFKNIEDANKCLQDFRDKGFELPLQTNPDKLLSITTFDEDRANERKNKRKRSVRSDEAYESDENQCPDSGRKKSKANEIDGKESRKRQVSEIEEKAESSEANNDDQPSVAKKSKNEDSESAAVDKQTEESDNNSALENKEQQSKKSKKNRKRKQQKELQRCAGPENEVTGYQVMSKKDWKKLRNKYLNMQRQTIQKLKAYMSKNKFQQFASERNKMETEVQEAQPSEKAPKLEFTPNVIVKIDLKVPWEDKSTFKAELRANSGIKYIDIEENPHLAFIRFDSSDSAKAMVEKSSEERQYTVLEGEEEKGYWDKVTRDRENKISGRVRVKQRGRDKLTKKADKILGKHIKFDEV